MIANLKIEYLVPGKGKAPGVEVARVQEMQIKNLNIGDTLNVSINQFTETGALVSLTLLPEMKDQMETTPGGIALPGNIKV